MKTKKPSEYETRVNATDRSGGGAVGKLPLCIRWVDKIVDKNKRILDFGSGKHRRGQEILSSLGYSNVDSFDIGSNVTDKHVTTLEEESYDVVVLSNVLNVQGSVIEFIKVIDDAVSALKPTGILIWNYPLEPRKWDRDENYVVNMVSIYLPNTQQLQPYVYVSSRTENRSTRDESDNDGRVGRLHGRRFEVA